MIRLDQKVDILMKYFREGKSQRKIREEYYYPTLKKAEARRLSSYST